jgi:hypothetical protein
MRHRVVTAIAALLFSSPAYAEVADKEPTLSTMWAWALALNVVAFLLEKVRPRFGLFVLPLSAFIAWGAHSELSDPFVGPAILNELGSDYVQSSYASVLVGLVGPILIVALWEVLRRRGNR